MSERGRERNREQSINVLIRIKTDRATERGREGVRMNLQESKGK